MVNKRWCEGRVQGRGVLRKKSFSSFTRCSRRIFLYVDGLLDDGRDGVMFLFAFPRLPVLANPPGQADQQLCSVT